ncbi:porin [Vibrio methylphosphonaticus]|uniref:porin n=1 Tax=Vibrio methylphosphonaticus TaxID=2946866 RepID=UPI00202A86EF|nr:porin [Vibrio methylphosphonaticus]MCL9777591.1 porin [Vibrio methylphosphonaticus]
MVASLIALSFGASAASLDDIKISGFGSVGIGKSNNDAGYAGYTSERADTKQDTIGGIQFDFDINDKAKFTTQLVANGRYDFEPTIEVAYLSYKFDGFTARAGKMRTPLFMYSDYLDVGYAYPMIRPSQEVYEHIIINSYTGADLLIPFSIGETTLQIQPFAGVSQVEERDSTWGEVDLNQTVGLTALWYVDDFTFRGSYVSAKTSYSAPSNLTVPGDYAEHILDDKNASFISLGAQYDNGDFLAVIEGMDMQLEGRYSDVRAVSGLVGYRIDSVMPYFSMGWNKTTDNDERDSAVPGTPPELHFAEQTLNNFERLSYSAGTRWDFAQNMALKLDVTYVDYRDTSGGLVGNINTTDGSINEKNSLVYSATVDFVF